MRPSLSLVTRSPSRAVAKLAALTLFVAACAEPVAPPVATEEMDARPSLQVGQTGARLLDCPTPTTRRATRLIDPKSGGYVTLNGTSIVIPPGAIPGGDSLGAVPVTITLPASRWLEIDIRVDTAEHFRFATPVLLAVSYEQCRVRGSAEEELGAWFIDGTTRALIDRMDSWLDRRNKRVFFWTDHLSGYGLATRQAGESIGPQPPGLPGDLTE